MGFLSRLLGREKAPPTSEATVPDPICPHATMTPHWDSAEDMGKPERVTRYTCEGCKETFSGDEGRRLLDRLGERLPMQEETRV